MTRFDTHRINGLDVILHPLYMVFVASDQLGDCIGLLPNKPLAPVRSAQAAMNLFKTP